MAQLILPCSGCADCFTTRQRYQYPCVCASCNTLVPTVARKTGRCAVCFEARDPSVGGTGQPMCRGATCNDHIRAALTCGAIAPANCSAPASDMGALLSSAAAWGSAAASDRPPPPPPAGIPGRGGWRCHSIRQRRRIEQCRRIGKPARVSHRPDRSFGKRGGALEASPKLVDVAGQGTVA